MQESNNLKSAESLKAPPSEGFGEAWIWKILEQVTDPEVPVLTITDLGIVRDVKIDNTPLGDGGVEVIITPT